MADSSDSSAGPADEPADAVTFTIGDVVHDREDDDPNDARVVNTPSVPANEWIARQGSYAEKTVAEDNPDYPADAPVIAVVYAADLHEAFPDWTGETPLSLDAINESDASYYSFPAPRLTVVDSRPPVTESSPGDGESEAPAAAAGAESPATDDPPDSGPDCDPAVDADATSTPTETPATAADLSASMRALKDRLEDGGMTVEIEADGKALSVTKLGDSYRVRPGEVIEGEGALRSRLTSIVAEFA